MNYLNKVQAPTIIEEREPLSYRDNFAIAAEIAGSTFLLGIVINVILGLSLMALMTFSLLLIGASKAADEAQAEIPLTVLQSVLEYILFAYAINCAAPIGAGLGAFVHNLTLNNPYKLIDLEEARDAIKITKDLDAVENILNTLIENLPSDGNISDIIKGNIAKLKALLNPDITEVTEKALLLNNNSTRQTSLIQKLTNTTNLFTQLKDDTITYKDKEKSVPDLSKIENSLKESIDNLSIKRSMGSPSCV